MYALSAIVPNFTFGQIEFGLRFGGNVNKISDVIKGEHTSYTVYSHKIGYHIGLSADFPISKNLTLKPELIMYKIGDERISTNPSQPALKDVLWWTYYAFPVSIQYRPLPKWFIESGFDLGLFRNTYYKQLSESGKGIVRSPKSSTDFIIGMNLGVGFNFTKNLSLLVATNPFRTTLYRDNDSRFSFANHQLSLRYYFYSGKKS